MGWEWGLLVVVGGYSADGRGLSGLFNDLKNESGSQGIWTYLAPTGDNQYNSFIFIQHDGCPEIMSLVSALVAVIL